jgi:hypothetical protein
MSEELRVFLNERGHTLPAGAVVRDVLRAMMPELLPSCETGEALVTDGRGLPVSLDMPLQAGAILRAARRVRGSGPGAAAHDAGG